MAKKQMSELKRRALLAKQRLKMGYWQQLETDRKRLETETSLSERGIVELQQAKLKRDMMFATDAQKAKSEETLYEKVCKILDENEDTLSPIGQLIDKELYRTMDESARQKYILELSGKFRELSRRYYLEHSAKTS